MDANTHTDTGGSPRRSGRARRAGALVALVVGVTVLSSATTSLVWANHTFPDVPTSSPHHGDVSWAVENGITQGYGDGTFRPNQAVSRQTMATFLRRLSAEFNFVSSAKTYNGDETSGTHFAECPVGKRSLAGGVSMSMRNVMLTGSRPAGRRWVIAWEMENDAPVGLNQTVIVYALCAPGL